MNNSLPADRLRNLCAADTTPPKLLVVLAHPDDETVGAGAQLPHWSNATFLYLTQGAPRVQHDPLAAGFESWQDYAAARWMELERVFSEAAVPEEQIIALGAIAQEVAWNLVEISEALTYWIAELRPEMIVTHPYEGGDPDHDATAFAVHAACRQIEKEGDTPPPIAELTSYHRLGDRLCYGEFLAVETDAACAANGQPPLVSPDFIKARRSKLRRERARAARSAATEGGANLLVRTEAPVTWTMLPRPQMTQSIDQQGVITCRLTPEQQQMKQRWLASFATQPALAQVPVDVERFRWAPAYDFRLPPHLGPLGYELSACGMTGSKWRELARRAQWHLRI